MTSRTEKKLKRTADWLVELFPKRAKAIRHEFTAKAKRISKRGSHKKPNQGPRLCGCTVFCIEDNERTGRECKVEYAKRMKKEPKKRMTRG